MHNPARFTVDDLTVDEHQQLARLVKCNPGAALADPSSQQAALALAGLAMLRDRRGRAGVKLEDYSSRTLRQLQDDLGLTTPDHTPERIAALVAMNDRDQALAQLESTGLDLVDPNHLDDDGQRLVVWALTGIDPGDDAGADPHDQAPTADEQAQLAADQVTGGNGLDPTDRPGSPYSGT